MKSAWQESLLVVAKTIIVQEVKNQEEQLQVPWQFPEQKGISCTSKPCASVSSVQHTQEKACLLHRGVLPKPNVCSRAEVFQLFYFPKGRNKHSASEWKCKNTSRVNPINPKDMEATRDPGSWMLQFYFFFIGLPIFPRMFAVS